jgi:hypothetical protein
LIAECALIEEVAEDSEGEDGYCKTVAGIARVASSQLGQDFVVIFW